MVKFHENTNDFMKFMVFHDLGGKRARPGSPDAGKPGSPDPGKPGSPEARIPGSREAESRSWLPWGRGRTQRLGSPEAGKPEAGKWEARMPGCREAGKPGSRSQILDFKGRGEIPKGHLNITGWGEASKRQLDIPPVRTIRHGLYGASPFRTPAPNLLKFL